MYILLPERNHIAMAQWSPNAGVSNALTQACLLVCMCHMVVMTIIVFTRIIAFDFTIILPLLLISIIVVTVSTMASIYNYQELIIKCQLVDFCRGF